MIKLTLEFQSPEAAAAALAKLSGPTATVSTPAATAPVYTPPAAPAPGPYVPPAPAPAAPVYSPAPAPAPAAPAPGPYVPPAPAAAPGGITQAQLVQAAQGYSKRHTAKGTKAVLDHFQITKISEANPAIYPQLLEALSQ